MTQQKQNTKQDEAGRLAREAAAQIILESNDSQARALAGIVLFHLDEMAADRRANAAPAPPAPPALATSGTAKPGAAIDRAEAE